MSHIEHMFLKNHKTGISFFIFFIFAFFHFCICIIRLHSCAYFLFLCVICVKKERIPSNDAIKPSSHIPAFMCDDV
jgi:hypothetical protein